MAIEGELSTFHLPDILQVIAHQQKTGILTLQGEREILAVSFLRGQIVAADALNQSFEDGLGHVLASRGILRPEAFAELVREHALVGGRFSDFLVSKGVLTEATLLEAMRLQIYRLVLEALRWNDGAFKFYVGNEVVHEPGIAPISVEELLLRSMSDLIGEGTLSGTVPHGFVAYEALPPSLPVQVGVRDLGEARDQSAIWISADEERLYRLLDGVTTAGELARRTGLGEYKTLYALFRLLQLGLARPAAGAFFEEPPALPPEAAAPLPRPEPSVAAVPAAEGVPELVEVPARRRPAVGSLVGLALAGSFWVGSLLGIYGTPLAWLEPPVLAGEYRQLLERNRLQARFLMVDRAMRTYHLLEGRFPESLSELVARGLLSPDLIRGFQGATLETHQEQDSYRVRVPGDPPVEFLEAITGDLLLDPTLYRGLREEGGVPLILLD